MINITLEFRGLPIPSSTDDVRQIIEDIENGKYPGFNSSRHDINIQIYQGAMKKLSDLRNTFKISEEDELSIVSVRDKLKTMCQSLAERYIDNEDKKSRTSRIELLLEDEEDRKLKERAAENMRKSFERVMKQLDSE